MMSEYNNKNNTLYYQKELMISLYGDLQASLVNLAQNIYINIIQMISNLQSVVEIMRNCKQLQIS